MFFPGSCVAPLESSGLGVGRGGACLCALIAAARALDLPCWQRVGCRDALVRDCGEDDGGC
eukprot:2891132-Heterocapsa_arctica.AAC.1